MTLLAIPVIPAAVFPGELETAFDRLEKLAVQALHKGTNLAEYQERERLRDFFVSMGDEAGRFLVKKLERMVAEERKFIGDSADPNRGTEYITYLIGQKKSPLLKYDICWILADLFPHLSSSLQGPVLKAIESAYTPSSHGELGGLDAALLRIGPRAVPSLLRLAAHKSRSVRCSVSETLNGVASDLLQAAKDPSQRPAPPLDCESGAGHQTQILAWEKWWMETGEKLPFPQYPSFFDLYKSFQDRLR